MAQERTESAARARMQQTVDKVVAAAREICDRDPDLARVLCDYVELVELVALGSRLIGAGGARADGDALERLKQRALRLGQEQLDTVCQLGASLLHLRGHRGEAFRASEPERALERLALLRAADEPGYTRIVGLLRDWIESPADA